MSQTSIITVRSDKLVKEKSVSVERKTHTRRYSDINIMMLEGHKKVSIEEEKTKLFRKG